MSGNRIPPTPRPVTDPTTVHVPLWSGMQQVEALWFDAVHRSAEARALRMLAAWRPGARALRFVEGDLLRFPAATLCACEMLPGQAMCAIAPGVLASAPLTREERVVVPDADLLIVSGARVLGLSTNDGRELDLSAWIEPGDIALHDTFDCTPPPAPPDMGTLRGKTLREALGDKAPDQSPELQRFLERARDQRTRQKIDAAGAASPGFRDRWFPRLFGRLAGAIGSSGDGSPPRTDRGRPRGSATTEIAPRQQPVMPSALRAALTRLAVTTGLSHLIGLRQAAYLHRLMALFDEGDLREALRHALPLGEDSAGSRGQSFGLPGPRAHLALQARNGPRSSIYVGDDAQTALQKRYRRAFEALDRQGRIDEAAFVLGELLNSRQECLDYLERHSREHQAAELALGWQMPAATIVRLLLLAGDWHRAVLVARRDRAFAEVVTALRTSHPALAIKLRLAWADFLADRGDWLGAVDVVWPVAQARHLAVEWLRIAESADGTLSARALVCRAVLLPDTLDAYAHRIDTIIAGTPSTADPQRDAAEREALAIALLQNGAKTEAIARLASALLPVVAADRGASANRLGKQDLQRLLTLCNDPYLRADLPQWSLPHMAASPKLWARDDIVRHGVPAPGVIAIADVAPMGDGRYLLALGEAGVAVCDRRGRIQQRYPVPATSLAIAEGGAVALAIARRESTSRITRLDLVRRIVTDLGAMQLDAHAAQFDGLGWSIVADNRIQVIDTSKTLRDVLWHVDGLPGPIVSVRYGQTFESYLIRTPHGDECWHYDAMSRRLHCRNEVRIDEGMPLVMREQGSVVQPATIKSVPGEVHIAYRKNDGRESVARLPVDLGHDVSPDPASLYFRSIDQGLMFGMRDEKEFVFGLYRFWDGAQVAEVRWPADAPPTIRESWGHLLFCDNRGRVLVLPLQQGAATAFSVL